MDSPKTWTRMTNSFVIIASCSLVSTKEFVTWKELLEARNRPRGTGRLRRVAGLDHAAERRRHHDLGRLRVGAEGGEHLIEPLPRPEIEIEKEEFSPANDASPAATAAEPFFADFKTDLARRRSTPLPAIQRCPCDALPETMSARPRLYSLRFQLATADDDTGNGTKLRTGNELRRMLAARQ